MVLLLTTCDSWVSISPSNTKIRFISAYFSTYTEAARAGQTEVVKYLLENGADINQTANPGAGDTPYYFAVKALGPNHATVRLLRRWALSYIHEYNIKKTDAEIDIDILSGYQNQQLQWQSREAHDAAAMGNLDELKELAAKDPVILHSKANLG